jgi:hypothetical protein
MGGGGVPRRSRLRGGVRRAVADDQWPGSRLIAAEKATTAKAMSVRPMALSTANIHAGSLPGGPLLGLRGTSPVNPTVAFAGDPAAFGTAAEPMLGKPVGGVVAFGGGFALYDATGIVGGLGARQGAGGREPFAQGRDRLRPRPEEQERLGLGHPLCAGTEADIALEFGAGVGGSLGP